ncbi:hypothetical protein ABVT39_006836 [Epinephelus coioides]
MRDMMWIYAASILLLSEVWSMDQGPSQNFTNINSTSYPKGFVVRHLTFNLGSEANLTCSNKTWNETIFVTWTLTLKNKNKICRIAFTPGDTSDYCNDGKSLQNTSRGQSYLHIPNFSNDDVGDYRCESVYNGGVDVYLMHVNITVPPTISMWLEHKDNKMVAVCRAAGGKPAANISWSHAGNSLSVETNSHGFLTVESRLELPEGMDTENLSCVVRHQYWEEKRSIKLPKAGYVPRLFIIGGVVIIVLLAGVLFFIQQKLILRRCKKSVTSPSKPPPTEDVEEVEPYASYVQRVNSIYNSSADLFT